MEDKYIKIFDEIKKVYPDSYEVEINNYINNLKTFSTFPLIRIAIFSMLREAKKELIIVFSTLYSKYDKTNFLVSELNEYEKQCIVDEYIKEVERLGKEYLKR